ncbi:MAG: ABC transporter permease [Bacilli bacterium]
MQNKLWFLTKFSLKKKVATKWFMIANIIIAIGIIGITNIDSIITFFGGDFNDNTQIVVIDNSNEAYNIFKKNMEATSTITGGNKKTELVLATKNEQEETESLKGTKKILVVLNTEAETYLSVKVISDKFVDTLSYQMIASALTSTKQELAMSKTNIDKEELENISAPVKIDRVILETGNTSEEENMNMIMGTVFPTVILPFFMLVIFLVQMIGAEINEEKSTRSMEIIISNVSPKTHFFSKIFASNMFVLIQGALLMLYGGIGLLLRSIINPTTVTGMGGSIGDTIAVLQASGFIDKLIFIIPLTLILIILSFLAYSLLAGILASMTVSLEDYQQMQTPIMFICFAGYFLSIAAGMFEGSVFIKALAFVPFISSLLAPSLLILGQMSITSVVIAIAILGIFDFLLIKYGLKIYKIGILNYSTDKMWSRLFKAAKIKE